MSSLQKIWNKLKVITILYTKAIFLSPETPYFTEDKLEILT